MFVPALVLVTGPNPAVAVSAELLRFILSAADKDPLRSDGDDVTAALTLYFSCLASPLGFIGFVLPLKINGPPCLWLGVAIVTLAAGLVGQRQEQQSRSVSP